MGKLNIVIPMAGLGSRFRQAGYTDPKPFIMINGKRMIERVIENLTPKCEHQFIFIAQREHLDQYGGYEILNNASPGCVIIPIDGITEGAACTVLLAKEWINDGDELIIANSDQLIDYNVNDFLDSARSSAMDIGLDGLIMTMWRNESKWSFVGRDSNKQVNIVVEKNPISNEATVGIYYYQLGSMFVDCAEQMIAKNIRHNNEFYVAPVYNQLLERGYRIDTWEIPVQSFHGLGTPEDLEIYLNKTNTSLWC